MRGGEGRLFALLRRRGVLGFSLLVELFLDSLPRHREHHGLQHIRGDARGQSTAEQALHAVLFEHTLDGARVTQLGVARGLLDRLHDAQRVGDAIGHDRRRHTDQSVARVVLQLRVLLRDRLLQVVERREPRVVADPVRREVRRRAVVQHSDATSSHLILQQREGRVPLHLQRRLERVHGR